MDNWKNQDNPYPARLQESLDDGVVRCHLSPRNCKIRPGQHGFCMVRTNRDGQLFSLNYGRSVHATEETIETEAVNHYAPGARILSMGNIGCMLNCNYCHNWKTSQARFVADSDVYRYSPEEVVAIAKQHGIRVISWTYNDPVVWHEFVTETGRLAQEAGIINLFKSAFFISAEAVEELLPVIDIFSISIKSMDPVYYRKLTKGWIEPVLEATKQVYQAGKHVEVSTLMVTDLSDNETTSRAVATFVGEELDPSVPTHFVRFHPDYKMTDTIRTPIDRLVRAREIGLRMGLHHVYLGNVYDTESTNTYCRYCGHVQVTRYGLNAQQCGVAPGNVCGVCAKPTDLKQLAIPDSGRRRVAELPTGERLAVARHEWHGDVRSLHVQVENRSDTSQEVYERRFGDGVDDQWQVRELAPSESHRFIVAKAFGAEQGAEVAIPPACTSSLHEVYDRAHFPTMTTTEQPTDASDVTPFPRYDKSMLLTITPK